METKLTAAYDALVMPEHCVVRIENAITASTKKRAIPSAIRYLPGATACLLVLVLLFTTPTVVQALERIYAQLTAGTAYVDDHYYYYNNGRFHTEGHHDWNSAPENALTTDTSPVLSANVRDGRLYFTANGEKIDISEQISYETPFTYQYTDAAGITHYIAVGGEHTPETGLKNIGILEFLRYQPEADANSDTIHSGWMGGYSDNYCDPEGNAYPWVISAFEILEIPFAPPGN